MTVKSKSIVIAANTSWGLYNFRKNLILSLVKRGYRVIAISMFDGYTDKLKSLGCECLNIEIDSGGKNPFVDSLTILQLLSIYRKMSPDLVLHFTPKMSIYSSIACSFINIKYITNISGLGIIYSKRNIFSILVMYLYKFSQRKASKVFFQNDHDRANFINSRIVTNDKSDRLPGSGVDLNYFNFDEKLNTGNIRFILSARMILEKGILEYVNAAIHIKKIYPKVEFLLMGPADIDNPSSIKLSTISSWVENGYVNYLGALDDVRSSLSRADCVVLPSYYAEGVPKALLEAGAMGKVIITTDTPGCRDTVDEGVNGYLCAPRSVEDLINKLEQVIRMKKSKLISMGQNSRRKIESEFNENIIIDKYMSSIRSIIQK
jgi:glycosyltransferase involved in cell wall biosynthesis